MYSVPFLKMFRRSRENNTSFYKEQRIGTIEFPDKLTVENSFILASTVTEIFWPIDFCADRISKLRFFIADKNGKEVENTELNRFVTDINPFYSFNDLVYQKIFSWYADGNGFNLLSVPKSLSESGRINASNITRSDIIQPNLVSIDEYTNIPIYKAGGYSDMIRSIRLEYGSGEALENKDLLQISKIDGTIRENSAFLGRSILFKGLRSINNLLAVYSARYNAYVNNGSAGLLVSKQTGVKGDSLDDLLGGTPATRDQIITELNDRKGLTGNRQFWGISSQPLEFINTIATIKDLMPMEETLENTIKVASIFQIPSGLVPRKDDSKYDNQNAAERNVWENSLMSLTDSVCKSFTKEFRLDAIGYKIMADYSSVSALASNEAEQEAIIKARIENLNALKALVGDGSTTEIDNEIIKILQHYGKG